MEGRSFAIGANVPSLTLALVYTVAARATSFKAAQLSSSFSCRGAAFFFLALLHPTRNTNRRLASAIAKVEARKRTRE